MGREEEETGSRSVIFSSQWDLQSCPAETSSINKRICQWAGRGNSEGRQARIREGKRWRNCGDSRVGTSHRRWGTTRTDRCHRRHGRAVHNTAAGGDGLPYCVGRDGDWLAGSSGACMYLSVCDGPPELSSAPEDKAGIGQQLGTPTGEGGKSKERSLGGDKAATYGLSSKKNAAAASSSTAQQLFDSGGELSPTVQDNRASSFIGFRPR